METVELFDLLERCSTLSIRGNTKAIQQATALVERITALETAGREVVTSSIKWAGNLPGTSYYTASQESLEQLAALLGETK